ncbi:MAG: proline dehydrogenase family protein [Vampirovibrionales bacterium]
MSFTHRFNQLLVTLLPLVPKPIVKAISASYVAGETMDEMLACVAKLNALGARCTVDLLGEYITHLDQAHETARAYHTIVEQLAARGLDANVSVKPTALGLLMDEAVCTQLIKGIVQAASQTPIQGKAPLVRLDMEHSDCTTPTVQLYLKLRQEFANVGIVLQAYLRRTLGDVRHLCTQLSSKGGAHFRLCKGIYVEPRTLAFKDKEIINRNYVLVLEEMLKQGAFVGIATHDERLVWEACRLLDEHKIAKDKYEFQMLLGVDEAMRDMILSWGHPVRIYVPYGKDWYGYCTRRLKENPAVAGHVFNATMRKWFPWFFHH